VLPPASGVKSSTPVRAEPSGSTMPLRSIHLGGLGISREYADRLVRDPVNDGAQVAAGLCGAMWVVRQAQAAMIVFAVNCSHAVQGLSMLICASPCLFLLYRCRPTLPQRRRNAMIDLVVLLWTCGMQVWLPPKLREQSEIKQPMGKDAERKAFVRRWLELLIEEETAEGLEQAQRAIEEQPRPRTAQDAERKALVRRWLELRAAKDGSTLPPE